MRSILFLAIKKCVMSKKAIVTFYGGVGSVTGANFLCESGGVRMLIDCGLIQGGKEADIKNHKPFPYDPHTIDALVVTHAHMDHIGRIPQLVHAGFRGDIYSIDVTRDIAELMFSDALSVMAEHERVHGVKPLYTKADVEHALSLWKTVSYHVPFIIGANSLYAKDAGHILGSMMVEVTFETEAGKRTVVFTGDLGNSPSLLLQDTESIKGADYVVMESVYGNRNHESKEDREHMFVDVVEKTLARGGTLVIPAFSLERTQMILYLLNNLLEDHKISSVPVFLDSPLAIKVTDVYRKISKYFKEDIKQEIFGGDDIFDFPTLKKTLRRSDSRTIHETSGPKIVIAGSGMSEGGRIAYHEAQYLPDERNTLLLVGYQGIGTLGRTLLDGASEVSIDHATIPVRAHIEQILGFSSHKDMDHLVAFIHDTRESVKKVFVVMGEPKASLFLAQRLRDYVGVDARAPDEGETVELI